MPPKKEKAKGSASSPMVSPAAAEQPPAKNASSFFTLVAPVVAVLAMAFGLWSVNQKQQPAGGRAMEQAAPAASDRDAATHDLGVDPQAAPTEEVTLENPSTVPFEEHLANLRAGKCDFGTRKAPGTVLAVDYSQMKGFKLPGGVRCPLVITGLEESDGWSQLMQWAGNLEELEKRTHGVVEWDQANNGEFAYWDNKSLLSAAVREKGYAKQGYLKVEGPKGKFFKSLPTTGKPYVRYGGRASKFSSDLSKVMRGWVEQNAPVGAQEDTTDPLLWLSGPQTWSTAHYDSFHNFFAQLLGVKRITLAPPQDGYHFHLHPGTHPLARQSRLHFAETGGAAADPKNMPDEKARVLEVAIGPNAALFIPSMWMHHVLAESTSVSLALTSLPFEHYDFNGWITDFGTAAPFLDAPGQWDLGRLVGVLMAFVPAFLEQLGFVDPTLPDDPLNVLVNRSYGLRTRKELGLPSKLAKFDCPPLPSKSDVAHAKKAAKKIAKRLKKYQPDQMVQYLQPYFETVLSRAAGPEKDIPKIMGSTVSFVEYCIHPLRRKRAEVLRAQKSKGAPQPA